MNLTTSPKTLTHYSFVYMTSSTKMNTLGTDILQCLVDNGRMNEFMSR